jgi:hypothetical protein
MLCGGAVLMLISLALGEHREAAANWPLAARSGVALPRGVRLADRLQRLPVFAGQCEPAVATSYAFVNPLIAIFLGAFFAGEHVTGSEWAACGVILMGVFLIFRGKSATSRRK